MISPEVVKEGAISIELLEALVKDSPSIPCQPHQPQEDNLISGSELIDDPASQSFSLDSVDAAKALWKLGEKNAPKFKGVAASTAKSGAEAMLFLKVFYKGAMHNLELKLALKGIQSSIMTPAAARALANGSLLVKKTILKGSDVFAQFGKSTDVIVPIGNSGGLYSETAGVAAKSVLQKVLGWTGDRVTVLMDFNHENNKLYDINRLFDEVSKGLPFERIGMTTSKVLNDRKYPPNAIEDISRILVADAKDYDTGFHTLFATVSKRYRNTKFTVPVLGGGAISESQGQAWINALKAGNKNVHMVLDIELMTGKPLKYYNAALRLSIANYDTLLKGMAQGNVKLFRNGKMLSSMPSRDELQVMFREVQKVVDAAKIATP